MKNCRTRIAFYFIFYCHFSFVDSFSSIIGTWTKTLPHFNIDCRRHDLLIIPTKITSALGDSNVLIQVATARRTTRLCSSLQKQPDDVGNTIVYQVEEYLAERYPMYTNMILRKNEDLWKKLLEKAVIENGGFTIFTLTDKWLTQNVITNEKIMAQVQDPRNIETLEKISLYHTVNEIVSYEALCNAGGIQTMGGIIPVEENKGGNGLFSFFGKNTKRSQNDDELNAPITINGANIIRYYMIDNECSIFEIDNLISPKLLWRYMDQLRIPGTK
jgi:uncharacterized surface protein with fasciclin (FAS1) repeats